jgi:hypothetical protein
MRELFGHARELIPDLGQLPLGNPRMKLNANTAGNCSTSRTPSANAAHTNSAAGCSRCASGRAPGLRIPAEARIVSIALTGAVSDARGVLHLTPDCMTLDELEGCINGLQAELDVLRAEPRRSFDSDTGHA